ncbi:MAG: DNA translocase FtsK, partial [Sulfurimonas sp.]|nr:DNA translocase FtsK [Sulfurimonas sp.]
MKDTVSIIVFSVLIYLGFATILGDAGLMGSYGSLFASYNHLYFGYISYLYLFVILVPLYMFYKHSVLNFRKAELTVASFLLLFSFLLAQAILIDNELRGQFAANFVDFLSPYIGVFGLWTFLFIITSISTIIILDKNTQEIASLLVKFLKSKISKEEEQSQEPVEVKVYKKEKLNETYSNTYLKTPPKVEEETKINTIKEEIKLDKPTNLLDIVKEVKEQKNILIVDELEENAKLLEGIEKGKVEKPKNFKLPSVDFLQKPNITSHNVDESEVDDKIRYLIEKLAHFKIDGDVVRTYAGPVVSTFEFKPAANVKVSKILNLQDDLAMALSAETIRIQAPIPGKDVVGIEIPNEKVETIYLRELLDSKLFKESSSPLTIALGKDIVGKAFITDLKKLP